MTIFSEQHRLKDRLRLRELKQCGEMMAFGYWRLYKLANGLPYPRLALVVAKRYVRLAVKRNLIRRLVRECFRHRRGFCSGYDYLLVVAETPSSLEKSAVWGALDGLLIGKSMGA